MQRTFGRFYALFLTLLGFFMGATVARMWCLDFGDVAVAQKQEPQQQQLQQLMGQLLQEMHELSRQLRRQSSQQQQAVEPQRRSVDQQPPAVEQQLPAVGQQLPAVDQQLPAVDQQTLSSFLREMRNIRAPADWKRNAQMPNVKDWEAVARKALRILHQENPVGHEARLHEQMQQVAKDFDKNLFGEVFPAETTTQMCHALMILAALPTLALGAGSAVVEHGTFMGYSTRCIAAGAEIVRRMGGETYFYAFDLFTYIPSAKATWKQSSMAAIEGKLRDPQVYEQQVRRNVLPYDVKTIRGQIGKGPQKVGGPAGFDYRSVSFFSMDASKERAFSANSLGLVASSMPPGSLLSMGDSLADNAICSQLGLVLGALWKAGFLSLFYVSQTTSHTL
eukprot:TRINITY_DN14680_c0_g1_i1.p1 TRINITY_DN14680_c0_g1~~TRINITY_DN14680_c0_g1_i1.p1  ORF type:complete len:392 (-),score=60.45 TRINITY_DN14680_c0_g1_i1:273-1448(-)